jgi:hypothetical protein
MPHVSATKIMPVPADRAWDFISNWGGTDKWIPGVGPVDVEGSGVGAIRSAELASETGFPGRISERLETFSSEEMTFSYCVIGNNPIPIKNYLATMSVKVISKNSCEVTWQSTWDTVLDEADLIAAFNGLYNLSLENAARLIAEDTSK